MNDDTRRLPGIDADIRRAWTLPGAFYTDETLHRRLADELFARTWQLLGDVGAVHRPGAVCPRTLLEGSVDEPLLLTRDAGGTLHCLSNVCTHRGNLVVDQAGTAQSLRCRYHGRRFGLDGRFLSMPEFEGVQDFPAAADDLAHVACDTWGPFVFASLRPAFSLQALLAPMQQRLAWFDLEALTFDQQRSRDYEVQANWALYCDNYLEGFHIPFVHAALHEGLDFGSYRTELFEHGSVQVGIAKEGEEAFDLPPDSPDRGQRVAGYYFWLFPNLMFNVYPWGVSINLVKPQGVDRTRVSFLAYVGDASRLERGAGGSLDRVEREDEDVVEAVQRGVRSRLYRRGRYSPRRESGVHHFHRLLSAFLATPILVLICTLIASSPASTAPDESLRWQYDTGG